ITDEEQQYEKGQDDQSHAAVEAFRDHADLLALPARLGGQHQAQSPLGIFPGILLGRLGHEVLTAPDDRAWRRAGASAPGSGDDRDRVEEPGAPPPVAGDLRRAGRALAIDAPGAQPPGWLSADHDLA